MTLISFPLPNILAIWLIFIFWAGALGIYRTLVDRIRSGLVASPSSGNQIVRLFSDCLQLPNHERPFHVEASTLSSLQILLGFLVFSKFSTDYGQAPENHLGTLTFCFVASLSVERISSWMFPKKISQSQNIELYLKIALLPVMLIRLICKPLSILILILEKGMESSNQKMVTEQDEESEVADHIRVVGREGANLDPEILEIMGNTIEMSQLKVNDVMIPRNQVQILDVNDSFSTNLEIAKSCGHTRLPLCDDDLDKCLGVVHVKYAFRALSDTSQIFDLRKITKAPARLSREEPLPVALKRMMKLKVHMALVGDQFGGIDGVITLEDILEEVVGEIQDEFDSDEKAVEKIGENKWRVSGLVPVHDLPDQINLFEDEDDTATVGGVVTKELGRIPENQEILELTGLQIKILEADDTRVLSLEIQVVNNETAISEETE
tara:strand:+ start:301 stop:1611 length:1311 start_codon:yes stop_codon:yes gene_type:complete